MTDPKTRADWDALANRLAIRGQAFVDGRYVDAASGETFDCLSPIDGRVLAQVSRCAAEDVDRAVRAARRAFDAGDWANAKPAWRKKVLVRLAELVRANADELALLETLDMGKPIAHALAVDVTAALVERRGRVAVYEPRGELQLVVESMLEAGQGKARDLVE